MQASQYLLYLSEILCFITNHTVIGSNSFLYSSFFFVKIGVIVINSVLEMGIVTLPLDWDEIVQMKRPVKTSDQTFCGNVMAEYKDNLIVIDGSIVKLRMYMIPKSKVESCNEQQLRLKISSDMLSIFDF